MFKSFILFTVFFAFVGCITEKDRARFDEYAEPHELRKLVSKKEITKSSSGGFFLLMGGYNSSEKTESYVLMSFKNEQGEFQNIKVCLDKIRIKEDAVSDNPSISFLIGDMIAFEDYNTVSPQNYDEFVTSKGTYILVHCKKDQFTNDVDVNRIVLRMEQ